MLSPKMRFSLILCLILLVMSAFGFGCEKGRAFDSRIYAPNDLLRVKQVKMNADYSESEILTYSFVRGQLSSPSGGVYTNYLESNSESEMSIGHEILSESTGLMMLYAIQSDNKTLYDEQFKLSIQALLYPTHLVKWRIRENDNGVSESSATIDDLRIVRSLVLADALWGDEKYSELFARMSEDILTYNTYKGHLVNYYSKDLDETGKTIDLSYIDIRTMAMLTQQDRKWVKIMDNGLEVIEGGMISDDFPLYYKTFDIVSGSYLEVNSVNMIDSLTTVLHLSEVGVLDQVTVDWLYKQLIEAGHLYSEYDIHGIPVTKAESTAAYALVARIAKATGDQQLYRLAMDKMTKFQVKDRTSVIYGSFGNHLTLEVFSYDNLQALLAY